MDFLIEVVLENDYTLDSKYSISLAYTKSIGQKGKEE